MAEGADNKNRNIIIAVAVVVITVVIGVGVLVWTLGSSPKEKPNDTRYSNITPGTDTGTQRVGDIEISPAAIPMSRSPDGRILGLTTVSAVGQAFTFQSIHVDGDSRIVVAPGDEGSCKADGKLAAGARCQIRLFLDPNLPGQQTAASPALKISGTTLTPGGSSQPLEKTASITGVDPATAKAGAPGMSAIGGGLPGQAAGLPGQAGAVGPTGAPITSGPIAGAGIDPYGPVAPNAAGQNYAQQPQVRPLSAREQFMIARRQAVLGNVVRTDQAQAPAPSNGDWDEIGVKKTVSSYQQDMTRVITMDRVITAVLSRPFDSRQTQQVVAQVDRNVYGGMGRTILIPRGSNIIGTMTGGADRVAVVWTQIIRPDGARFVFTGSGGDAMGQAGVPGRVNNQYFKRLGAGFLGTVLKVATALATKASQTPNGGTTVNNAPTTAAAGGLTGTGALNNGGIVTQIVTDDINAALAPIIAQAQAIKPIITVPAGTRVTILPTMDLVMRPVQRQTIVRPSYPRPMNGGAQISAAPQQSDAQDAPIQNYPTPQRQQAQQQALSRSFQPPVAAASGSTPPWSSN